MPTVTLNYINGKTNINHTNFETEQDEGQG